MDAAAPRYFASAQEQSVRALAYAVVGQVQLEAGRFYDALASLERARVLLEALQPAMSPERADLLLLLARTQLGFAQPKKAVPMAAEAMNFWRLFDASNRQTAVAALWHAQALLEAGEGSDVAQALREAEASVKASGGQKEQAWLGKLKRKVASGAERAR